MKKIDAVNLLTASVPTKETQQGKTRSMNQPNTDTITGSINAKALELLAEHPNGIRWTDLNSMLQESNPDWHPKTINGCVWKLTENFPDQVHKPEKGLFQLRR